MERMVGRGEEIARRAQQVMILQLAARLEEFFGEASVEGSRVAVSGRGLVRRWLSDSRLRFIGSELR